MINRSETDSLQTATEKLDKALLNLGKAKIPDVYIAMPPSNDRSPTSYFFLGPGYSRQVKSLMENPEDLEEAVTQGFDETLVYLMDSKKIEEFKQDLAPYLNSDSAKLTERYNPGYHDRFIKERENIADKIEPLIKAVKEAYANYLKAKAKQENPAEEAKAKQENPAEELKADATPSQLTTTTLMQRLDIATPPTIATMPHSIVIGPVLAQMSVPLAPASTPPVQRLEQKSESSLAQAESSRAALSLDTTTARDLKDETSSTSTSALFQILNQGNLTDLTDDQFRLLYGDIPASDEGKVVTHEEAKITILPPAGLQDSSESQTQSAEEEAKIIAGSTRTGVTHTLHERAQNATQLANEIHNSTSRGMYQLGFRSKL